MQGEIIDTLIGSKDDKCRIFDPFVGSGTVMTEALLRNLSFTGVDINPLAALVCQGKVAIDKGADIEGAAQTLLKSLRRDTSQKIEVSYPGRHKWFSDLSSVKLSSVRRSIQRIEDSGARKVMWTVFAETIRLCSNSRTSTYKLHVRRPEDYVPAERVIDTFETQLRQALIRVRDYRANVGQAKGRRPAVKIICDDIRNVRLRWNRSDHQILVTSPPYGDNQTTIPYGQFSYLAMRWIPEEDLPGSRNSQLIENTNSLDSASLGGKNTDATEDESMLRAISPCFDIFLDEAEKQGKLRAIRKVSRFIADFQQSLLHLRECHNSSAHWVLTTGNRTAAGMKVPFDGICRDIIANLGGKEVVSLRRKLPNKRMPSRNSQGEMITTETIAITEFS